MVKSLCKHYSPALLALSPPPLSSYGPPSPRPDADKVSLAEGEAEPFHPFPSPSVLASPTVSSTLRQLGFGYRAEFIQRTARMLLDAHPSPTSSDPDLSGTTAAVEPSEKWLLTLRHASTPQAREELLKFVGVGRKVADCVLLMSLDKVGTPFPPTSVKLTMNPIRGNAFLLIPMSSRSQSSTMASVDQRPRRI
jgi:N-glycosylase/DNA lyase